jgi:hypothetical protein
MQTAANHGADARNQEARRAVRTHVAVSVMAFLQNIVGVS